MCTFVKVEANNDCIGLGEFSGDGEVASNRVEGLVGYLKSHNLFELEAMHFAIYNPIENLHNNHTQLHVAIKFACLSIMG